MSKRIDDWIVEVDFDTSKAEKAAARVERILRKSLTLQGKVESRAARGARNGASGVMGPAPPKRLSGEALLIKREKMLARVATIEAKINSSVDKTSKRYKTLNAQVAALRNQIASTTSVRSFSRLTTQVQRLGSATTSAAGEMRKLENATKKNNFAINSLNGSVRNLATSYVSVFAVLGGGQSIIDTATRFDSLDASMLAASGSAKQAAVDFEFIKKASFEMGIGLETVTDGFRQIGSAQRFSGVTAEDSQRQFNQMLKITRSFGLSSADVSLSLLAFQQMISKGVVSSEELRRQLGERLPGAVNVAAEAMGVTTLELSNMLKKGEVVTTDFLPKFLDLYESLVVESGAYAKSLKTITVAQQNLVSQWQLMLKAISEGGGKGKLITTFENLRSILENIQPQLTLLVNTFGVLALAATGFLNGFTSVVGPFVNAINYIVAALGSLVGIIVDPANGLISAFEALGMVMGAVSVTFAAPKIIGGLLVVVGLVGRLIPLLREVRNIMGGIAVLTGISTGGLSAILGVAGVGVALGVSHLNSRRGAGQEASTTNNTSIEIGKIESGANAEDIERVLSNITQDSLISSY